MDRQIILEQLNAPDGGTLTITDIQMEQWGRQVIFKCRYRLPAFEDAPEEIIDFSLIFGDCREIKYRVYAHISEHEQGVVTTTADVAEIALGQDHHRRDANLLTNHFAVTLSYGRYTIERDPTPFPLN